jgi:gluconolactonase
MNIVAFTLDPESGKVTAGPKVLVDFKDTKGCDGMCVDTNGNLYLTVRDSSRPGVLVVNPRGEEIAHIPTGPADQGEAKEPIGLPSNVEFGVGDEASTLYVTVDKSLYRIGLKSKGHHVQYGE